MCTSQRKTIQIQHVQVTFFSPPWLVFYLPTNPTAPHMEFEKETQRKFGGPFGEIIYQGRAPTPVVKRIYTPKKLPWNRKLGDL